MLARMLLIGLFLLFGLPLVLIVLLQLGMSVWVNAMMWHVYSTMVMPEKDPLAAELQVENHRFSGSERWIKDSYEALASFDTYHRARIVRVAAPLPVRDLRTPDTPSPSPTVLEAMAKARAAQMAQQECQLLRASFALRCRLAGSDVKPARNRDDAFLVDLTLQFVQVGGFGAIEDEKPLTYNQIGTDLHGGSKPQLNAIVDKLPDERFRIYQQIRTTCQDLRASQGNCAIDSVQISSRLGRGTKTTSSAKAHFSTLVPNI